MLFAACINRSLMSKFHCPVCQGAIATWVVRAEFSCHHCSWVLRSNTGQAFASAVAIGLLAEVLLFVVLWMLLPRRLDARLIWLSIGCVLGYLVRYFHYRHKLIISAVRPQRAEVRI
jgi:hypothetical protein